MNYPELVKETILDCIRYMGRFPWLFSRSPQTDFSRKRKLDFETMMKLLLSMESSCLNNELLKFFHYSPDSATVSAFNQQRNKLLPEAFEFLFQEFNRAFPITDLYHGLRLIACDGSDLNIARNPKDTENYFPNGSDNKGFNQLHLNALYDLCSRRYVDAIIQPGVKNNECRAMADMVDRYRGDRNTLFIADRGYESYNVFAHIQEAGMYYLIRARDSNNNCIIAGLKQIPNTAEYDVTISLQLTRKQTKEVKSHPEIYKFLVKNTPMDYIDLHVNKFYPITMRIVRFRLQNGTYECIITNLPSDEFPIGELKELYHKRWGIETSFRELKYAIGMTSFHAKKVEYIKQEIFARLTLYNFCEIITTHVVVKQKDTKHVYQLNYTMAIHICRYFLGLLPDISPPDVEALISRYILPVRPGRRDPRKVTPQTVVSFLYRAA